MLGYKAQGGHHQFVAFNQSLPKLSQITLEAHNLEYKRQKQKYKGLERWLNCKRTQVGGGAHL